MLMHLYFGLYDLLDNYGLLPCEYIVKINLKYFPGLIRNIGEVDMDSILLILAVL